MANKNISAENEALVVSSSSKVKDSNASSMSSSISYGIVISGEASESDEEIDSHHGVNIPQSASELSISDVWTHASGEIPDKIASKENAEKYNTLLHKKQREKNQTFRRDVVELVTQPYDSATKEIRNISQQLIKSQLLVQELRDTIKRLTSDLFDMEDKMEALKIVSSLPETSETSASEISG